MQKPRHNKGHVARHPIVQMRKHMRRTRPLLAIVLSLFVVLAAACAMPWIIQPDASSDSTSAHGVNGLLRPAVGSTPAPVTTPLTVTSALTVTAPLTITTAQQIKMSTEQQMARVIAPVRDLRELAMRLVPNVGEIPLVVNKTTPDYQVGDQ